MGVFESLFGFLTGSAAAAAGAGINHHNKKKRWNEYVAQEDAKLQAKVDYAKQLRDAEDEETRAFRRQLEGWIGGPLEEDQKKKRYYNLPREFELAIRRLDVMYAQFKQSHPPGSSVRHFSAKFTTSYNTTIGQVICDFVPEYQEKILPYETKAYEAAVREAFWKRYLTTYKGPKELNGKRYAVTYFVGPGMYALGEARQQIIREGFLPSNCRDHLWINWSPYVQWTGNEWNREFHTAVDLAPRFDSTYVIPHPSYAVHKINETQRAYEKQHPERFKREESNESSQTQTY